MANLSSSMVLGIVKKAGSLLLAVWILVTLNFLIFYVGNGDPMGWMVPRGGSPELMERVIDEARLDESLLVQYADYLLDTLTGDFRVSTGVYRGGLIQDFIWEDVGNTVALMSLGVLGSLALGVALESAAGRRGGPQSALAHGFSVLLMSLPVFSFAILSLYFAVELDLGLPIHGDGSTPLDDGGTPFWSLAEHILLPATIIILASAGLASLLMREGVRRSGAAGGPTEERLAPFASGLVRSRPAVHFHIAWTMAAALMVDVVFSYGGLGTTMWNAIVNRDIPVLMAVVFLVSMIVMAASCLASLCLRLVGGTRLRDLLTDWGRRESEEDTHAPAPGPAHEVSRAWTESSWKWFKSSVAGMSALVLLGVIIVLGVLAPVIAPAPDPSNLSYLEPNIFPNWRNPLPPSLEPSPYSGMTHYLGTDYVGRDVLSLWLFGARDAGIMVMALILGAVAIGLAIGALASETVDISGPFPKVADFLLTAGGRALVAIPLPLFVASRFALQRDIGIAPVFVVLAFYAWAWFLIARPVRAATRRANGRVSRSVWLPTSLAESLSVAKFAVPLAVLVQFQLYAIGLGSAGDITWGALLESAFAYSAFMTGDWHLILPPLVGAVAVCSAAFVLLDRAEQAVRTSVKGQGGGG